MSNLERLTITKALLAEAGTKARVDSSLISSLWDDLEALAPDSRFAVANVAYYFGTLVIIAAMTWFTASGWSHSDGTFKLVTALIYAGIFSVCGFVLGTRDAMRIPSGLLYTAAVCMTPLAVYGFEATTNLWIATDPVSDPFFGAWDRASWVPMESATIVAGAGAVAVYFVRFPFLVAPIAVALWWLSIDLASFALGGHSGFDLSWDQQGRVSIMVGVAGLVAAVAIDRLAREDYAFWLFLFGSLSVWSGILILDCGSGETGQFLTLLVALAFIASVIWRGYFGTRSRFRSR